MIPGRLVVAPAAPVVGVGMPGVGKLGKAGGAGRVVAGTAGLGRVRMVPVGELAGRAMGAEFFFGLATLKIPHMQHALETAGWQLIGFTSGYDREQVAPGVVKRVFEGVYTKVLVPEDEVMRPDPRNLTPKARALFDVLFPEAEKQGAQAAAGAAR